MKNNYKSVNNIPNNNFNQKELLVAIEKVIDKLGFELIQLKLQANIKTLEVIIDSQDISNNISISDCKKVSSNISVLMNVYLPNQIYNITVSSADIERPLLKLSDYQKFCGKEIKVRLRNAINDNKHYSGKILRIDGDVIYLQTNDELLLLQFDNIKSANLLISDLEFKKLLNKK